MHADLKRDCPVARKAGLPRSLRALIGFSAVIFVLSLCYAQVDRGGLSGTVTGSSGQVLPNTHITFEHFSFESVQGTFQPDREPGVPYSFLDLFHEVNGKSNPLAFATCGPKGSCGAGATFGQRNYIDIDPRVAFAWSPKQSGKTVLRGGSGMYHEDGQLDGQNPPNTSIADFE